MNKKFIDRSDESLERLLETLAVESVAFFSCRQHVHSRQASPSPVSRETAEQLV